MSKKEESVKVAIRCRPLSETEKRDNRLSIIDIRASRGELTIRNPKGDPSEQPKVFTFDAVYDWNSTQDTVYNETAYPIIDSALEGYNGTIFAYGQTGTGKTYTMEGPAQDPNLRGIIPRAFEHIFHHIDGAPNKQFLVYASFLELYNEELRDLLAPNHYNRLELRENPETGVYVKDLSRFPIQSVAEMNQKLNHGRKSRHVGETEMNRESSRSHAIFMITVEASDIGPDGESHIRVGKLNLVDLAGSERQNKTKSTEKRLQEAININRSLSTLGNVISALVDPKATHVPYRDSKLTRLLQDSLGGNAKTVMIANIGPADWNYEESLSTLRYANRAKSIKNKPRINEDPKDAMLREFQEEIQRLRAELEQFQHGVPMKSGGANMQMLKVEDQQKIKEMEEKLAAEKEFIRKQAEEERRKIEEQKNLAEEEKMKLLKDLKQREETQKKQKEDKEKLLKKLKKMEDKVLIGTKVMEQAVQQEKEFLKVRQELEEKRIKEQKLAEELAKREEENILMEKKYHSKQEEIEDKQKKLHRLYQKFQAAKAEIQDQADEFNREKEYYQDQIRELTKELKLKNLIINSFIPYEEVNKIERRSIWSEELDDWVIQNLEMAGNFANQQRPGSAFGFKRPISAFGRKALQFNEFHPRFKTDNILKLDFDMPERTVEEYTGEVSQKVQNTLNIALNKEEDEMALFNLENHPNIYYAYTDDGVDKENVNPAIERHRKLKSAVRKVGSALKKNKDLNRPSEEIVTPEKEYPKARGLVGKNAIK